jgi:RNA methyltransferase, TrmH family
MNFANFKKISSIQNEQIKRLKKLALKKYRIEYKEFAVENWTIIHDALESGIDFRSLFLTAYFAETHQDKIDYLFEHSKCPDCFLIDEKINNNFSQLETPSGITAAYKIINKELTEGSAVYLDQINDPGNLGTILRSALAFGFENIILGKNCADIYNPKTISAARDAIFKLNIREDGDGSWWDQNNLPVYITSSRQGFELSEFRPAAAFCLALGSESHGISAKIADKATRCLKIEMSPRIESLNVASAAAILFYELRKKQVMPEGH